MTTPQVIWETIDTNDFVFKSGDYFLRVEKFGEQYWSWCMNFKDDHPVVDQTRAKTEAEAKLLAELCFFRHWQNSNKTTPPLSGTTPASPANDVFDSNG